MSQLLDLGEKALCLWVKQPEEVRGSLTPKFKSLKPDQQKIQELEARINRLEREKILLNMATALLDVGPAES